MDTINRSNRNSKSSKDAELPERTGGLSRRSVLKTVPIAAGGVSAVLVSAIPAAGTGDVPAAVLPAAAFGAPLVELHVPPGVLTLEQKGAMIKGVTDVLVSTTKLLPDQAKKLWVQLFETAEGGWGVGGQVFVPRGR